MASGRRPPAFWVIVVFLAVSIPLMLIGQTMAVFNYDFTVRLGLQESLEQVGEFGVQVNRAFGAADTFVYIPLIIASLLGLLLGKRWSLLTTAAFAGASVYWSATVSFIFQFAPVAADYNYVPPPEIWIFVGAYMAFGIWSLFYLLFRGETLLR